MGVSTLLFLVFAAALHSANAQRRTFPPLGSSPLDVSLVPQFSCRFPGESEVCVGVNIAVPNTADSCKPPISVTAVLDRSGSMKGKPLDNLIQTVVSLVNTRMESDDSFGVVAFSDDVTDRMSSARLTASRRSRLRSFLVNLEAKGHTNIEKGLSVGLNDQIRSTGGQKYVILFTDGKANKGEGRGSIIGGDLFNSTAGAIVHTIGFGSSADAQFLKEVAERGRGSFIYIEDTLLISRQMGSLFGLLESASHKNVNVRLSPLNGAEITSVKSRFAREKESGEWKVSFPDLAIGEERNVLVCMKLPESNPLPDEFLDVLVTSTEACTGGAGIARVTVPSQKTCPRRFARPSSPKFESIRLVDRAVEDLEEALRLKESGNNDDAVSILENLLTDLRGSSGSDEEIISLIIFKIEEIVSDFEEDENLSNEKKLRIVSFTTSLRDQRGFGGSSIVPETATQLDFAFSTQEDVKLALAAKK